MDSYIKHVHIHVHTYPHVHIFAVVHTERQVETQHIQVWLCTGDNLTCWYEHETACTIPNI